MDKDGRGTGKRDSGSAPAAFLEKRLTFYPVLLWGVWGKGGSGRSEGEL